MKRHAFVLATLVAWLGVSTYEPDACAQERASAPDEATRLEAADRFDRGIALFKAGDAAGALAEFKRVYQLRPNVLVLYNIGLVEAELGRPVDATVALDEVLAHPGTLSAPRLERAKKTRDEQAARIADVEVTVSVPGASIEVDGVEAGVAPLGHSLRVAGGTHVIGAVAAGYAPLRKELTIASGEKQPLALNLVPMQGRMAHVAIKTHLVGAEAFVDGERVGTTPLPASVSIVPGAHRIELRRAAYTTAHADLNLGEGAVGEVTLEPEVDHAAVAAAGSSLALDSELKELVVTLDGHPTGLYVASLPVAPGPHVLFVEHGGFVPLSREVTVAPGRTTNVRVALDPTAEYRAQYVARARTRRRWGLVTAIGGAAIGIAGGVLAAYDANQRSSGQSTLDYLASQTASGEACHTGQDGITFNKRCNDPKVAAQAQVNNANTRDIFAWSGVGVGAAAIVTGIVLYVTSDDPHAYDQPHTEDGASGWSLRPTFGSTGHGGSVGLVGTF